MAIMPQTPAVEPVGPPRHAPALLVVSVLSGTPQLAHGHFDALARALAHAQPDCEDLGLRIEHTARQLAPRDAVPGLGQHQITPRACALEARIARDFGVRLHHSHGGHSSVSHAIEHAIGASDALRVLWLQPQDRLTLESLARVVRAIRAHPDHALLLGRAELTNGEGVTTWSPLPVQPEHLAAARSGELPLLLHPLTGWLQGRCIVGPEAVASTSWIRAVGGIASRRPIAWDVDLWCRLLRAGALASGVDVPIARRLEYAAIPGPSVREAVRDVASAVLAHSAAGSAASDEARGLLMRVCALCMLEARLRADRGELGTIWTDGARGTCLGMDAYHRLRGSLVAPHLPDVVRKLRPIVHARFAPRVAVATGQPAEASALVRSLVGSRAHSVAMVGESWPTHCDLAILDGALVHRPEPGEFLDGAITSLTPGGLLVLVGELQPWDQHGQYVRRLVSRMQDRLLRPMRVFVDIDADEALHAMVDADGTIASGPGLVAAAERDARAWRAVFPSPAGYDAAGHLRSTPLLVPVLERRLGSAWGLPVLPLPWMPSIHIEQRDLWLIGAWQRAL